MAVHTTRVITDTRASAVGGLIKLITTSDAIHGIHGRAAVCTVNGVTGFD